LGRGRACLDQQTGQFSAQLWLSGDQIGQGLAAFRRVAEAEHAAAGFGIECGGTAVRFGLDNGILSDRDTVVVRRAPGADKRVGRGGGRGRTGERRRREYQRRDEASKFLSISALDHLPVPRPRSLTYTRREWSRRDLRERHNRQRVTERSNI